MKNIISGNRIDNLHNIFVIIGDILSLDSVNLISCGIQRIKFLWGIAYKQLFKVDTII